MQTVNVYLLDGDTPIDVIYGVSLPKLADLGVAFAARFTTEGVHHHKIALRDVTPGILITQIMRRPSTRISSCLR